MSGRQSNSLSGPRPSLTHALHADITSLGATRSPGKPMSRHAIIIRADLGPAVAFATGAKGARSDAVCLGKAVAETGDVDHVYIKLWEAPV